MNLAASELAHSPSIVELLEMGTADEVREAIETIAIYMHEGRAGELGKKTQEAFGLALYRIAAGENPSTALGLNRKKKFGAWYAKQMEWLIKDLMRQGMTRSEAEDFMGRLDLKKAETATTTLALDDRESADERLRKRITRARTK